MKPMSNVQVSPTPFFRYWNSCETKDRRFMIRLLVPCYI